MALPGYAGTLTMKGMEAGISQPDTTPPNVAPPWTAANITAPAGVPVAELRCRLFEVTESKEVEKTTPTGVYGRRRNSIVGYEIAFRVEVDFPGVGDSYASDLPDIENVDLLYIDALVGPLTSGSKRSRRIKGYFVATNIRLPNDSQAVAKWSFDAVSEGPYYFGPYLVG